LGGVGMVAALVDAAPLLSSRSDPREGTREGGERGRWAAAFDPEQTST